MRIWKFKRRIEKDKRIGNFNIATFHYGSFENGKHKDWTELNCWYECDCENCPFSWESRGYEGECYDDGCRMAKPRLDTPYVCVAKTWVCLLPRWVKRLIKRMRGWDE